MDATPGPTPPNRPRPALAPAGELVIQNGRLQGTRQALGVPLTCIGQGPACDLRLSADGVGSVHCLIVHGPGGFVARDLGGPGGMLVNGEPVGSAPLHDGDLLAVGPVQMKVRLPRLVGPQTSPAKGTPAPPAPDLAAETEALRIQVAAVVAQQTALGEEEARLQQRRATLEQQEAQLSAHLESKRRRLVELHSQVQSARASLKQDQAAYKRHVEKVTGDLSQAERDLLGRRQQAEAERRRAISLQHRLRERYSRNLQAERAALRQREGQLAGSSRELEAATERLRKEQAALAQACLRFNGEVEVRRRQLQDEWDKLRREQKSWQEQRLQAEADLGGWQGDLDQREAELAREQQAVRREREQWLAMRLGLQKELTGLENRVRNQRRKVTEQQQEVQRLELARRGVQAGPDSAAAGPVPPATDSASPTAAALVIANQGPPEPAPVLVKTGLDAEAVLVQRLAALEGLAGELADQRLQLAEQWELLARARAGWGQEYEVAAAELRLLATRLHEQGQAFLVREQQLEAGACEMRRRHEEMGQQRQHLVGWQARLRARELAWEAERDRLVAELRGREQLAERHLAALADLRQRWAKRRRHELELVREERAACEMVRQQYVELREERRRRQRELEEQRSQLGARALALEQQHRETLTTAGDAAAAERRIERLRRRWLMENTAALRALKKEREALLAVVTKVEERHAALYQRATLLSEEGAVMAERQTDYEQQQVRHEAEQAQLRDELQRLQGQRDRCQQEAEELRSEVEHIARQLLDEPDAPPLVLGQAA
jgi:hypothetical protein